MPCCAPFNYKTPISFIISNNMLFFKQWPVSYNIPYEKIGDEGRSLAGEVPFEIPDSWEWVRLGSVVYNRGQTSPSTEFCYIDIGSIDNKNQKLNPTDTTIAPDKAPSRARKLVDMGDILYSTVRPYLHNMCIIDREFPHIPIASTGFAVLTCHANLLNKYLFYYLMSPDFDAYANNTDNAKGVAYPAINDDRLYKALIPIPPVAEQHRIVSAIDSVNIPLCEYGSKEETLRILNTSFPENLKKSILQEAVQGKLAPQEPSDEPAEALLERIRAEKQRLIKEGKIKKDKHESVIFRRDNSHYEKRGSEEVCIDEEIPFEIPENWAWARLSSASVSIADGDHQPPPQVQSGIPFLVISNVSDGKTDFSNTRYVPKEYFNTLAEIRIPQCGDLLFTVTGSYGIVIPVQTERKFCFQRHIALIKLSCLSPKFMQLWLSSPLVYEQCRRAATGTAQKTVGLASLKGLLIPIPPLNEQERIVQKLNTLLALAAL